MGTLRLLTLLVISWNYFLAAASPKPPTLHWHRGYFNDSIPLEFVKNQKLLIACQNTSQGTIVEVSEECYISCNTDDCQPGKEFFTCGAHKTIGPFVLRTFSASPKGFTFTPNKTHFFTSLNEVVRDGKTTNLCRDGMKFKIVVKNEENEEMRRTTLKHALFSPTPMHSHHSHATMSATEHTRTTAKQMEGLSFVTIREEKKEKANEEHFVPPMLTDKELIIIETVDNSKEKKSEDMDNLYLLTASPTSDYRMRGPRHDVGNMENYEFDGIGSTVVYSKTGERTAAYVEVALPLENVPNPSCILFSSFSMATVILLATIFL